MFDECQNSSDRVFKSCIENECGDTLPADVRTLADARTLANVGPSADVRMLAGTASPDGSVVLTWETAREIDISGFGLHRAPNGTTAYVKINGQPIPAHGYETSGTTYSFLRLSGAR